MKYSIYSKKEVITDMYIESFQKRLSKDGFEYDNENPDYVFFLGGDGTFLRAVHYFIDKIDTIKFVGLNAGTLGFFLDYNTAELDSLINDLKNENYALFEYPLLKAKIYSKKGQKTIYAVNEIRVESPFGSMICDVSIDEHYLETFSGNGLSVCTSLGSTAYNKSLGGAIVQNDLKILQISEIASIQSSVYHSLNSSLIIDGTQSICYVGQMKNLIIGFDSEYLEYRDSVVNRILINLSCKKIKLIRKTDHNYIDVLHRAFIGNKEK